MIMRRHTKNTVTIGFPFPYNCLSLPVSTILGSSSVTIESLSTYTRKVRSFVGQLEFPSQKQRRLPVEVHDNYIRKTLS